MNPLTLRRYNGLVEEVLFSHDSTTERERAMADAMNILLSERRRISSDNVTLRGRIKEFEKALATSDEKMRRYRDRNEVLKSFISRKRDILEIYRGPT